MVTWIDADAPFYGSYFGRRNIRYRGHPDFRPAPTLASARGEPPPPPPPPPHVPARLVGSWPLDRVDGGRAIDEGEGRRHGVVTGAVAVEGPSGKTGALRFGGLDREPGSGGRLGVKYTLVPELQAYNEYHEASRLHRIERDQLPDLCAQPGPGRCRPSGDHR